MKGNTFLVAFGLPHELSIKEKNVVIINLNRTVVIILNFSLF